MSRPLAIFSILATLCFAVIVLALLFFAPQTSPLRLGISFYALAGHEVLLGSALVLVGLSGISLAVASWPALAASAARVGSVLLMAWGVTSVLAGVFPLDAPGAMPTLSGSVHNLAGLNFLLVAPAALLMEAGAGRQRSSRWAAWLVLASAILLFIFNAPLSHLGVGGLVQRVYWLSLVSWIMLSAWRIATTPISADAEATAA